MENLKGKTFGYMTVISVHHVGTNGKGAHWNCQCVCGAMKVLRGRDLKTEPTVNCGCQSERLRKERVTTHGHSVHGTRSREYRSWGAMKNRCLRESHPDYHNYGGRGISICPEWVDSFETFLSNMGICPEGYSLDRKDVDGDYTPENCCWASRKEQDRNKRNTIWVVWQGEKVQLRTLAERFGIDRNLVKTRYRAGWPLSRILSEDVVPKKSPKNGAVNCN